MPTAWISRAGQPFVIISQRLQSRLTKRALVVERQQVKVAELLHPILVISPLMMQDGVQLKRYAIDSSRMRVEF